jgi:hypothetical protein
VSVERVRARDERAATRLCCGVAPHTDDVVVRAELDDESVAVHLPALTAKLLDVHGPWLIVSIIRSAALLHQIPTWSRLARAKRGARESDR